MNRFESDRAVERMGSKLYIPRDINGIPNKKELEVIRRVEEKMKEYEAFIGIAPFGSVVGGYSSDHSESDIDLIVFYDADKLSSNQESDFRSIMLGLQDLMNEDSSKDIQLLRERLSIERIREDIRTSSIIDLGRKLSKITRRVSGNKIGYYREEIKKELDNMSDSSKLDLGKSILNHLIFAEKISARKKKERMSDITDDEHEEILGRRKIMWAKRIEKLWDLKVED